MDYESGVTKSFLKSASRMKGLPALPIIERTLFFAGDSDEFMNRLIEYSQPYDKPFRVWMGPKLFVVIKNPQDFKVVLNGSIASHKPSILFWRLTWVTAWLQILVRMTVAMISLASFACSSTGTMRWFYLLGATHKAQRKVIMPMVSGKELNKYIEWFDRQSYCCVECLEDKVDKGEFDMVDYMDDYTLDIILGELKTAE